MHRYTEALAHSPNHQLRVTLLLNRAQASLQQGNWVSAYADCADLLSLSSSPYALSETTSPTTAAPVADLSQKDTEKALYRAARALYALSVYNASLPLLESLLKSAPSNKDAQSLSNKTRQRIREGEEGKYDWAALLKEARTPTPRVDVEDYVGPVQLAYGNVSERKCWRTSRDVKAGELLLASKALTVLYPTDLSSAGESEGRGGMVFDATRALLGGSEGWELTRRIAEAVSADPNGTRVQIAMGLAKDAAVYDSRLGEEVRGEGEGVQVVDERAVIDMYVLLISHYCTLILFFFLLKGTFSILSDQCIRYPFHRFRPFFLHPHSNPLDSHSTRQLPCRTYLTRASQILRYPTSLISASSVQPSPSLAENRSPSLASSQGRLGKSDGRN